MMKRKVAVAGRTVLLKKDGRYLTRSGEIAQLLVFDPESPDEDGAVGVATTKRCSFPVDQEGRAIGTARALDLVEELPIGVVTGPKPH